MKRKQIKERSKRLNRYFKSDIHHINKKLWQRKLHELDSDPRKYVDEASTFHDREN